MSKKAEEELISSSFAIVKRLMVSSADELEDEIKSSDLRVVKEDGELHLKGPVKQIEKHTKQALSFMKIANPDATFGDALFFIRGLLREKLNEGKQYRK